MKKSVKSFILWMLVFAISMSLFEAQEVPESASSSYEVDQSLISQETSSPASPSFEVDLTTTAQETPAPAVLTTYEVDQSIMAQATDGRVMTTIAVKELKSKYFFIHLQLNQDSRNFPVKLYIYQQGILNPLKVCQPSEIDACYLAKQQMKENTNVLLLTDSAQHVYGFTLRTYWSDLEHLAPGDSVKFFFSNKDQTQLYHLELKDTSFYELRIILKPQTIRSPFDKIRIFGSFGDAQVSETKFDFKSIHLWEDAEGIFLYGHEIKDKSIKLLIVGQIQTVYTLSCETIQNQYHSLELGEVLHEYLEPSEDFTYHADFYKKGNQTLTKLEFEEYVLIFSGFSGKLSLGFFVDEKRKQSLEIQPFEYLSDAQYVFSRQQIEQKLRKGLYVYVHALERKSVFSLNFYGRNKESAIRLNENIHEFLQVDAHTPILTYFQIFHWANQTQIFKFEYTVALTNVIGEQELEFRTCIASFEDCISPAKYYKASQLENAVVTTIGTKQTFLLEFTRESLQKINHAQDVITVLVIIKNKRAVNGKGFAAIEYRSQNRMVFLREGKPMQTKIKQYQFKIFKFTNQDRFLKEIKIYVNEIAGKVEVYSLRDEPKGDNRFGKQETDSVLVFKEDLASKPIFLVVDAMEDSIFSLQVVTVHKSDQTVSSLTLTEDLEFSFKIKPQGSEIVQVVPIHDAIYFEYKASGSVLVCGLNEATKDCEQRYKPKLNKTGQIKMEKYHGRNKLFKLTNPSLFDAVQATVVYHSNDVVHCEQRQVGKLYFETTQKDQIADQGFQNNCYTFPIVSIKNMVLTFSRVDLGQLHHAVVICNSLHKTQSQLSSDKIKLSADLIRQSCTDTNQKTITLMISPHKNDNEKNKVVIPSKIKFLLENVDDRIVSIPDGVAYEFQARTTELPVKTFFYDMVNKKNTAIKLIQYTGFGAFSVQVVPSGKKQSYLNSTYYDYGFSKADSYFLNPSLTIKKQQLEGKDCKECSLIIKVYSLQELGTKVHFGLQVTQNQKELEDHEPEDGFLTKGSMAFYSYTTLDSKIAGSLLVEVNDYNLKCMRIFLSDAEYPDQKNFIVKEDGNQLVFKDVQPEENYYISLQALEDCPYSVTVSNTRVHIQKLKRGFSSQLSLKAGEVKYFIVEHMEIKEFRIISIIKYGQTYIYMHRTSTRQLEKMLQKQESKIDYKSFEVKSDYANRLVMHENNTYLKENSFYIVAVQGVSETEGYLFYGDSNTNLQIVSDTYVNDYLSVAGQVFRGEYYGKGNVILKVNVIVGELNIKVDTHDFKDFQNNLQFDKNFTQNQSTYINGFQIKPSDQVSHFMKDPIEVTFTAIKPSTVYNFMFIMNDFQIPKNNTQATTDKTSSTKKTTDKSSNDSTDANKTEIAPAPVNTQTRILPGHPNFVQLLSLSPVPVIINGTLTHGEQLFISAPIGEKQKIASLSIKALVEDKEAIIEKNMVRNIMKVKFAGVTDKRIDYKMELKSLQDVKLTIYQNYGLSLLTPDTQVLIEGTRDYVFYPENSVLLDLFECQDNATILYSNSKSDLDTLQSKSLDLIGMPGQPHAIKIMNPGATFVRIQSKKSYFRWLSIDAQKGKGMGYLDYDIGSISYTGSLLQLTVQWDPVYTKRQTTTRIMQVNYVLIVGANASSIKDAINCQNYYDPKLLYYHYNTGATANGQKIQLDLSKMEIKEKYSENQNLFIGLVADVGLRIPNQKQEKFQHYRFVYHTQEVPLQVFKDYTVASKDVWIISLIGAGVLLLISITCCICIKKIVPIFSRLLQGNALVEQNKEDKEFDVIPPSSDRNKATANNLQTQDQMK